MANVKNNAAAQETRRRLIETAGELFAMHGFHGTTHKQITDRAGMNVATVSYYFKEKKELYMEVLKCAFARTAALSLPLAGSAESCLREFVKRLVEHVSSPENPTWHATLFARELAEPSFAMPWIAESIVAAPAAQLKALVRELAPRATDNEVLFLVFSLVAQVLFFTRDRSLMEHLYPKLDVLQDRSILAERIADFVLAVIKDRRSSRARTKR